MIWFGRLNIVCEAPIIKLTKYYKTQNSAVIEFGRHTYKKKQQK